MNETLPLVPRGDLAVDRPQFSAMSEAERLIARAIDAKVDPAAMKELLSMRRELQAQDAKKAYDAAFSSLQAECPVVQKLKTVPTREGKVAYAYAPLEDIVQVVKPFLQKHGFSYTLDTDTDSKDGWVIAKCHVTHSGGHSTTSTAKFPLGAGTQIMSTTQVFAAALTFASRRVFCNAFGIVCAGEDLDGRTQQAKPKGPSSVAPPEVSLKALAQELWDLLKEKRGPEKNWNLINRFLWDECVIEDTEVAPEFTATRFREVIEKAKDKL